VGEPLTGRKTTFNLYPISINELSKHIPKSDIRRDINDILLYGLYPKVIIAKTTQDKLNALNEIMHSYLYKDILELDKVKSSKILTDLLQLVSYQVGSELNYSELGVKLGIDTKTVQRYLDLFEKAFILFSLKGYAKNSRNAITKMSKYYFYDVGLRNAVINNFADVNLRPDSGGLWENFIIAEIIKNTNNKMLYYSYYFWRNYEKKEVDLVEEYNGKLQPYEIKLNSDKISKGAYTFLSDYENSQPIKLINKNNYLEFLS